MVKIPRLNSLWRTWLRSESPRRWVLPWSTPNKGGIILLCLLVAITSSWQYLIEPELKVGLQAPYEAIAPGNALIEDTKAINQKKSNLAQKTFIQVIDQKENENLKNNLSKKLNNINTLTIERDSLKLNEIKPTNKEQKWIKSISKLERDGWETNIKNTADKMLAQGIINSLSLDQLSKASSLQLLNLGDKTNPARTLGGKILTSTFYGASNLKIDQTKSQLLLEKLVRKQSVPKIKVNKGDLITRKGEIITAQSLDALKHFGMISRRPQPFVWLGKFLEAITSCLVLVIIMRREKPCLQPRHAFLSLGLLLITQASKVWFGSAVSPLAVIVPPTLLISQGLGSTSALAWMAVSSFLWPIQANGIGEGRMMVACAAAALVALQGGRMRSRAQLFQMAILLPFGALLGEWILLRNQIDPTNNTFGKLTLNPEEFVSEALGLGAMLMLTILLIPILESTFGLITRARLLELADYERPLLRRLSSEAPGTFEHTLMICGLAEEGARTIGADVDLIRTGALYHDIGKLHAPEWFIENQTGKKNPHDQANDPFLSANILQAHVNEGLKLAQKYRLPKPVSDFIPEHQGTLKMGYFLYKAKELDPTIQEHLFRYKGPIPRSRETGILMLADGCEAALRALDPKTTNAEACLTVRRIFESRQRDGQLKESSLSRSELELIIRAFIKVWRRMRHRRISYPINSPSSSVPA